MDEGRLLQDVALDPLQTLLLACPQEYDEELHAPSLKASIFTAIEGLSAGLGSEAGPVLLEGVSIGVRQEDEFEFEL